MPQGKAWAVLLPEGSDIVTWREVFEWFIGPSAKRGETLLIDEVVTHTHDIKDGKYVVTSRTERRNGVEVMCRACGQRNRVWFERQGLSRCGACGLPLARVRYRGAR